MSGQRILGIDPGLRVTGFGVIEQHGNDLSGVEVTVYGCRIARIVRSEPCLVEAITITRSGKEVMQRFIPRTEVTVRTL